MKRLIAAATLLSLVASAATATADDHLVSLQLVRERLTATNQRRSETLRLILSNPTVKQAAAVAHVDPDALAARLSNLTDMELRDLADRAARLETDPVAGMSGWVKGPLIAFAVIGVLFIIFIISYATCDTCD